MASYNDIEKAKMLAYPIVEVMAHLGCRTDHIGGNYYAPWRNEAAPSVHIDTRANRYYDFGEGQGGNLLGFVARLKNITKAEAWDVLANIENLVPMEDLLKPAGSQHEPAPKKIKILSETPVRSNMLFGYAADRGIGRGILAHYCRQVEYTITGRENLRFISIGFPTSDGGWILRRPNSRPGCKRCTGSACSFLNEKGEPVAEPSHERVVVFEGFFDFLSWQELYGRTLPFVDICVLNSVNNLERGMEYILGHRKIDSCLDSDRAGREAFEKLKSALDGQTLRDATAQMVIRGEGGEEVRPKDVNEYLMMKRGLDKKKLNRSIR